MGAESIRDLLESRPSEDLDRSVPATPGWRVRDIVEQQKISLWRYPDLDSWHACVEFDFVRDEGLKTKSYCQGPTPLIAAMRCFAASKFWQVGQDEVASPSSTNCFPLAAMYIG